MKGYEQMHVKDEKHKRKSFVGKERKSLETMNQRKMSHYLLKCSFNFVRKERESLKMMNQRNQRVLFSKVLF